MAALKATIKLGGTGVVSRSSIQTSPLAAPNKKGHHVNIVEGKRTPKKIERFSHLPNVKAKVQAFEGISGRCEVGCVRLS